MKHILKVLLLICCLCSIDAPAQSKTAKLFIFRKQAMGSVIRPKISVNEEVLSSLPNKAYIECDIPAGNTTITMSFSAGIVSDSRELGFVAEPNKTYYVKSSVNVSPGLIAAINLKRITEDEGIKQIQKCKELAVVNLTQNGSSNRANYAHQEIESEPTPTLATRKETRQNTKAAQKSAQESRQTAHQSPKSATKHDTEPLPIEVASQKSDVDKDIPVTKKVNSNTYVLIVANEDYYFLDNVPFAQNDGNTFKEYCIKTLGIPEKQIWSYNNASLGILSSGVNKMVQAMTIFDDANAIIYYCGHGIPDEKTGDAYIVPTDGNGTDMNSCYSLNKLYSTMSKAAKGNVTYFFDACFTGAARDGSMLVAARGVAREAKKETVEGNSVVFSASSSDETAMPFQEKGHGLFTYFLLKKLQETKGNVTYGELADYLNQNVKKESFLTNSKPQTPVVATSDKLKSNWKNIKFK